MSKKINIAKEVRGRARTAIGPVPHGRRIEETRDAKLNRIEKEEAEQEIKQSQDES
jgi:hypothetical protein